MNSSIKELLEYTLKAGASDLHLSVGSKTMVRIHGIIKQLDLPVMDLKSMVDIKDSILNKHQHKMFEDKLEIDFSAALKGQGRFRVNFFTQINGLSAVFRAIPDEIKKNTELNKLYNKWLPQLK